MAKKDKRDDTEMSVNEELMQGKDKRDDKGRFLPGHGGGPGYPGHNRYNREFVDAMVQEFSPFFIAVKLRETIELAEKQKSPRAMIKILELILSYTAGKPTQRIDVQSNENVTSMISLLLQDSGPLLPPRERLVHVVDADADDSIDAPHQLNVNEPDDMQDTSVDIQADEQDTNVEDSTE